MQTNLFICLVFITILCSCDQKDSIDSGKANKEVMALATITPPMPDEQPNETVIPIDRKIIKEGEIAFQTKDVNATETYIKSAITEFSGYIAEELIKSENGMEKNIITIKVPAVAFDLLLNAIAGNAGKLDRKNISTLDVTEEYIDAEARIKSKLKLEERYFELLKQAKTMDEILKMEAQISAVRNEIESAQGRVNYINNRSAYSSLKVIYYEPTKVIAVEPVPGYGSKLRNAMSTGWNFILNLSIGLATIWPLLLIGGVIFYMVTKMKRSELFRRQAK
ncbi:MAG: DUF4349 domain-containing protein [Chitinophagales bacterium]